MATAGLLGIVAGETAITGLGPDGQGLYYRGYAIAELAGHQPFEAVAYLLSRGQLPDADALAAYRAQLKQYARIPDALFPVLQHIPLSADPASALAAAFSHWSLWAGASQWPVPDSRWGDQVLAVAPALCLGMQTGSTPESVATQLAQASSWAALCARLVYAGERVPPHIIRLIDTALVAYADHEWTASTFVARIVVSTLADGYAALSAAIHALKGVWHGGATAAVYDLLETVPTAPAAIQSHIGDKLARKERIMGFGHRAYAGGDPRTPIMRQLAQEMAECSGAQGRVLWEKAQAVERAVAYHRPHLHPNVDFYAACAYASAGVPRKWCTALFALARLSGWVAHITEQSANNRLIRPASRYTGPAYRTD